MYFSYGIGRALSNDALTWLLLGGLYVVVGMPIVGWLIVGIALLCLAAEALLG